VHTVAGDYIADSGQGVAGVTFQALELVASSAISPVLAISSHGATYLYDDIVDPIVNMWTDNSNTQNATFDTTFAGGVLANGLIMLGGDALNVYFFGSTPSILGVDTIVKTQLEPGTYSLIDSVYVGGTISCGYSFDFNPCHAAFKQVFVAPVVWGPASIDLHAGSQLIKNPPGQTWASTLLNAGALTLDTASTGCSLDGGTGVYACGLALTPANLDTYKGLVAPMTGSGFVNGP
jgi:hypothetical protein